MSFSQCPLCGAMMTEEGACTQCGGGGRGSQPVPTVEADMSGFDELKVAGPGMEEDPLLGQLVGDRFLINSLLGKGGVGRVYAAIQLDLQRPVALKVLDTTDGLDDERRERFRREAQASGRLNHPGVASVYDFGDWQGQPYIAMELVGGKTFYEVFAADFPLGPSRMVDILCKCCDVLSAAHKAHIIHRDLKPENIMVQEPGGPSDPGRQVKLLDFGMALLVGPNADQRLTQEGLVQGTPFYMSPEQCKGEEVGPLSDVYAVGVMLYEQLCGRLPFMGESPTDILLMHMFNEPEPPSKTNPRAEVPAVLEEIALRSLAKDPEDRPAGAHELARLLREAEASNYEKAPAGQRRLTVRRRMVEMDDRQARADALNIPETPREQGEAPAPETFSVLVVETPRVFSDSLTVMLRREAFNAAGPCSLDQARVRLKRFHPDVVVVDLAAGPEEILEQLQSRLDQGCLDGVPVVVVGPARSVSAMTRALELGIADYLPREGMVARLPRSLRRLTRLARMRRKETVR